MAFMGLLGEAGVLSPLPFVLTHFQEGGGAEKAGDKREQSDREQGCVTLNHQRCVQGVGQMGPQTPASSQPPGKHFPQHDITLLISEKIPPFAPEVEQIDEQEQGVLVPYPSLMFSFTWGMTVTYQAPQGCLVQLQLWVLFCREHGNSWMQEFESVQAPSMCVIFYEHQNLRMWPCNLKKVPGNF